MHPSQKIARLIGPVFLAVGFGVLANRQLYGQIAAEFLSAPYIVYLTGVLAMVAGLAILNAHPVWTSDWRSLITFIGCFMTAVGAFRILAPQFVNFVGTAATAGGRFLIGAGIVLLSLGAFLTFKGYGAPAEAISEPEQ